MLGWSEPKSRYVDPEELYDQLAHLKSQVRDLRQQAGSVASDRARQARDYAFGRIDDAEELVKDNVGASLLLALGVGLAVGFLLRRGD